MNAIKNILFAGVAAAAIVSANAENIYVTGSTAFRKAANQSILEYATNNGGGCVASDTAGDAHGASDIIFSYVCTTNNTQTNYIVCHWSGSEAGIQNVASTNTALTNGYVLPTSVTLFTATNSISAIAGTNIDTNVIKSGAMGSIAFSDTLQGSSIFKTGTKNGKVYGTLYPSDGTQKVGAVTFAWIVGTNGVAPAFSNVTSQAARAILANGHVSSALLSGLSTDKTNTVFLTGRDIDSGTRLTTLGETGYGNANNVKQYKIVSSTQLQLFPVATINTISTGAIGNSGYSSGSGSSSSGLVYNVKNAGKALASGASLTLDDQSPSTGYAAWTGTGANWMLGYAGTGDVGWSVNATGYQLLSYNGVTPSIAAVTAGSYTFWGYENLYYGPNASTEAQAVHGGIKTKILAKATADLFNAGVALSDLTGQISRSGDYGTITQSY